VKLRLLIFETKSPAWLTEARGEYERKLRAFQSFEIVLLKSPGLSRDDASVKRRREADLLFKHVDPARDALVLFDETGRSFRDSETFATEFGRTLETGRATTTFVIGGAYGFDDVVRTRATAAWSLSPLTMNHWLAQLAALEQLYRAFTIRRGIPYHNR
jgi:23S rRNA (pseudouridine1915-N3)-methyltransferase